MGEVGEGWGGLLFVCFPLLHACLLFCVYVFYVPRRQGERRGKAAEGEGGEAGGGGRMCRRGAGGEGEGAGVGEGEGGGSGQYAYPAAEL